MEVTPATWIVALTGLGLISILAALQLVAVLRPRADWTIKNVYGGTPDATDHTAYFAFNQGTAWADVFLSAPLQIVGSVGMLLGGVSRSVHTQVMERREILDALIRLGAPEPESWAASEVDEGIPQLARFAFLRGAWLGVIDAKDSSWMDRVVAQTPVGSEAPFAGTAHALRRLLEAGVDRGDLQQVVRGMQAELVFHLCYLLDDPAVVDGNDVVSWALFELDDHEQPARAIGGLHESVLETDPTGREMRPE